MLHTYEYVIDYIYGKKKTLKASGSGFFSKILIWNDGTQNINFNTQNYVKYGTTT